MQNILVVYYSFSNTTEALAREIATLTGGQLRALVPEQGYAFDYNAAAKEARSQIERGHCPRLQSGNEPIDGYDTIFIGSPNWFRSIAPPVLTFLRGHDFTGKTVVPFCTHGGGGFGQIEDQIKKECKSARVLHGLAVPGGASPAEISAWLEALAR